MCGHGRLWFRLSRWTVLFCRSISVLVCRWCKIYLEWFSPFCKDICSYSINFLSFNRLFTCLLLAMVCFNTKQKTKRDGYARIFSRTLFACVWDFCLVFPPRHCAVCVIVALLQYFRESNSSKGRIFERDEKDHSISRCSDLGVRDLRMAHWTSRVIQGEIFECRLI